MRSQSIPGIRKQGNLFIMCKKLHGPNGVCTLVVNISAQHNVRVIFIIKAECYQNVSASLNSFAVKQNFQFLLLHGHILDMIRIT